MKPLTLTDIRSKNPCYDPARYVAENWTGTILDILDLEAVPAQDRIWLVSRFASDRVNRLFAVSCARIALSRVEKPDPRSVAACDVAERFAYGLATKEELIAAKAAAWNAWVAVTDAATDAAWAAATDWVAARDAARSAQIRLFRDLLTGDFETLEDYKT